MKQGAWKPYAAWILLAEGVGGLAGWLTRADTKEYGSSIRKPPLSPPGLVFPIVWGILFLLMGIGAARIYRSPDSPARRQSLVLFLVQLGFNFFWSILFFSLRRFGLAFGWLLALWELIVWMIRSFHKVDPVAANPLFALGDLCGLFESGRVDVELKEGWPRQKGMCRGRLCSGRSFACRGRRGAL